MNLAYLFYKVRKGPHGGARGPIDSLLRHPSRTADYAERASALPAYRVVGFPLVPLGRTLEVSLGVLDAIPRGLLPLVDGGAGAGVPLLSLVAPDVFQDVRLEALDFIFDLLFLVEYALHATRGQAVQLAVLDPLGPRGEGLELRRVDAANPRLLLLADAPLVRDRCIAVWRVELDVGLEVVVHLLDGLDDLVDVEAVGPRPHEVALALLDELADLLPLVAVILEAAGKAPSP